MIKRICAFFRTVWTILATLQDFVSGMSIDPDFDNSRQARAIRRAVSRTPRPRDFPGFRWENEYDTGQWVGEYELEAWRDITVRKRRPTGRMPKRELEDTPKACGEKTEDHDPDKPRKRKRPLRVRVVLGDFPLEEWAAAESRLPDLLAAWKYTVEHQCRIRDNIFTALFRYYERQRAEALKWEPDYDKKHSRFPYDDCYMPSIDTPEQLHDMVRIEMIHVMNEGRDGTNYVGYGGYGSWTDEHGLGIVVRGDRVVSIGFADEALGGVCEDKEFCGNGNIEKDLTERNPPPTETTT